MSRLHLLVLALAALAAAGAVWLIGRQFHWAAPLVGVSLGFLLNICFPRKGV